MSNKNALIDTLSDKELKLVAGVHALEECMLDMPEEDHIDLYNAAVHHFAPGVYMRELTLPEGSVCTGRIHKTTFLNVIAQGSVAVSSVDGTVIYSAPCVFTTHPGVKRAVFAIEDTVWMGIWGTDETDLEKLEDMIIAKDYHDPALLEHYEEK